MYKLLTHTDLDAAGCAIVARLAFKDNIDIELFPSPNKLTDRLYQMLEFNYEENKFEYDDYEMVFVADTSFSEDVAEIVNRSQLGKKIVLLDHHASAVNLRKYDWATVKIDYFPNRKTCGTSLMYDYFLYRDMIPCTDYFINQIRELDTWEWEDKENMYAKFLDNIRASYGFWDFVNKYVELIQRSPGLNKDTIFNDVDWTIINIEQNKIKRYIKGKSFELFDKEIFGYNVGVVFAEQYHSELGNELGKKFPEYDLIAIINFASGGISFRTRRDDINLTNFARAFNGGGHPKASGCPIPEDTKYKFIDSTFDII